MSWLRNAAHDVLDTALDLVQRSGWMRSASYYLGLHGTLGVSEHALPVHRPPGAPPLRIGFASDFHAGPVTHPRHLRTACDLLADARPDVLLLGGDFISLNVGHVDEVARLLGSVPAPLGRFAVLGNHDYRRHRAGIVARSLELNGIEVLRNASVRLPPPHDDVWICGLDDYELGAPDADATVAGADGTRIVLMHGPDGLLAFGDRAFHVALAGHTHGGQVALPSGRPIIVPGGRLDRKYSHGLFHVRPEPDAGHLLVSRGVGCSALPIRLFAPPEVHIVVVS
jgi:predicted MPP superfamily phosphohydrolase